MTVTQAGWHKDKREDYMKVTFVGQLPPSLTNVGTLGKSSSRP